MPAFSYSARDPGGALVRGTIDGLDASAAASALIGRGIVPLDIAPAAEARSGSNGFQFNLFSERVKPIDILLFTRQLGTLLKSGVPILQALGGLQQSAVNPAFVRVLERVRESLASGHELSSALGRETDTFSPFFVSMIRVGESTGRMDEVLARLHEHIEFEQYMRSQVKSALRYPSFVAVAMVVAVVVVNLMVVPAFAKVFASFHTELPLLTRLLIASSNFMLNWWWIIAIGAVGGGLAWHAWLATPEGRLTWDRWKLRIPIAGKIILKATLSRFARSFALAARSGVPVIAGLGLVARTVDNEYVGSRIERMREGVSRGESVLRTAHAAGVFTPVALQMIAVGEESGALDQLIEDVADMYQRDVQYELKTLSAQLEPILITMLGVMVLILALGVFLPMWDLSQAMFRR